MAAVPSSSTEEQERSTERAPREHEAHDAARALPSSEADEPSADWGWHGSFPMGGRIIGWFSIVFLFAMAFFDHNGLDETWWLVVLASVLAVALLAKDVPKRSGPR